MLQKGNKIHKIKTKAGNKSHQTLKAVKTTQEADSRIERDKNKKNHSNEK